MNRWRLAVVSLVAILIGGVILVALLALGLADPPRAGPLQWQVTSPAGWPQKTISSNMLGSLVPHDLPLAFTIELTARNAGSPDSAWGIQIGTEEASTTLLIDNQGYVSIGPANPEWEAFLHSHVQETNTLYFHVTLDSAVTIRINDEIVRDKISFQMPVDRWRIVSYRQPQLAWSRIALYHQ